MPSDWLLISRGHVLINTNSNMGLPEADGREKEQECVMRLREAAAPNSGSFLSKLNEQMTGERKRFDDVSLLLKVTVKFISL